MTHEASNPETTYPGSRDERRALENRFEFKLMEDDIPFQRVALRFGRSAMALTVYCTAAQELDIVTQLPTSFEGFPVRTIVTGSTTAQHDK